MTYKDKEKNGNCSTEEQCWCVSHSTKERLEVHRFCERSLFHNSGGIKKGDDLVIIWASVCLV